MVPQGAEYQAICRGLKQQQGDDLEVVAIPVGPTAVTQYLQQWQPRALPRSPQTHILVMGLCGSLNPQYSVGDIVCYQGCWDGCSPPDVPPLTCDSNLIAQLQQTLTLRVTPVMAVTCDRVINTASEKQHLAAAYNADVVDMEGFAILEGLQSRRIPIAMVRVVSDDASQDLPDITAAFSPEGTLKPLSLALGMVRQPQAAMRLIRGSLQGLKTLEALAAQLVSVLAQ